MDAVNEFRKLLDFDLAQFQLSDYDDIQELNKKSAQIASLLTGSGLARQATQTEPKRIASPQRVQLDDIPVKNALKSRGVETFEELVDRTLEHNELEQFSPIKDSNNEKEHQNSRKKPFLRRGEGLRRFQLSPKNASTTQEHTPQSSSSPIKARFTPSSVAKLSTTIDLVQDTKRSIRELNLRNENHDSDKFSRKIISLNPVRRSAPAYSSRAAVTRPPVSAPQPRRPQQVHRQPSSTEESEYDPENMPDILKKFAFFCQNQNDLKKTRPTIQRADVYHEKSEPTARKQSIVKKIDQLEQRLLYLLNLKSSLTISTPVYEPREPEESPDCSEKTITKNEKKSDVNNSLENIKKEIVSLSDKIASISNMKQQQQQPATARQSKKERSLPKATSQDVIFSGESNDSDDGFITVPTTRVSQQSDKTSKTLVYKHKNGSVQTIFPNGMKVVQYLNGQIEKSLPDGTKQIIYADNQQKIVRPDKTEELHLADGRVYSTFLDGTEKVQYPNGDIELKTKDYTKRHFANGNIKTVYANGYQETIYSNGRIRLKDNHGNVLCDKTC